MAAALHEAKCGITEWCGDRKAIDAAVYVVERLDLADRSSAVLLERRERRANVRHLEQGRADTFGMSR